MLAAFFALLTIAAAFGAALLVASCVLLVRRKSRAWGFAVVTGGLLGAVLAFAVFGFFVLVLKSGSEALLSERAGVFLAAGFGGGGLFGAAVLLLVHVLQSPNRWSDRHRLGRSH
jgi:hypothetical protein